MGLKGVKDPYDQAQIMGNRARMNAKAEMERLGKIDELRAEIKRLEESIGNNEIKNRLWDEIFQLGRWYDDILRGV